MRPNKARRAEVDHEALIELIDPINEVHDTHPQPHGPEMTKLLDWKKKVWQSMYNRLP